jgi:hypothetical protein
MPSMQSISTMEFKINGPTLRSGIASDAIADVSTEARVASASELLASSTLLISGFGYGVTGCPVGSPCSIFGTVAKPGLGPSWSP